MLDTKPVFLYGVLQRSGTNLLNQILLLSPNVVQPTLKIRENWFLHHSDLVYSYSEELFRLWSNPKWSGEDFSKSEFYSAIGDALIAYSAKGIADLSGKVLLGKTPSVKHLDRHFEIFPSSKVLIIVRDPRDIAASAFGSWNRPISRTISEWNTAARTIATFERLAKPSDYFLIRYEDLILQKEEWVRKCIEFLGFDKSIFPWEALNELPVFGSSEEGSNWKVKPAGSSFKPIGRWKSLSRKYQRYFSAIDRSCLNYLGYAEAGVPSFPNRRTRIEKGRDLTVEIRSSSLCTSPKTNRRVKLRQALGLIAEATFGETITKFSLRKPTSNG